jgi:hypothetical protein
LTTVTAARKIKTSVANARICFAASTLAISITLTACGALYQAHTAFRTSRMLRSLEPGQTALDVHNRWGEPDIRNYVDSRIEIWSYAERPNTNDVTAELLYTAPKEGDQGRFLDLKFIDGKLSSWAEEDHRMPPKEGSGFSYGVGGGPVGGPVHY